MQRDTRVFRLTTGFIWVWWLFTSAPAFGQVSVTASPPAKRNALEDSVQALAGEVRELNATIQELRAEVSRSRQETSELRTELHGALEKLSPPSLSAGAGGKAEPAVSEARAATPDPPSRPVAVAQTPTEARLNRLEEDQELLQAKVDEQHQTKVESASKYRVKLSGIALLNLFGNSGTVDNQDVPESGFATGRRGHQRECGRYLAAIRNRFGSLRPHPGGSSNQRQCEPGLHGRVLQ